MGFFDWPYEKLVSEAPPQFRGLAAIALSRADERLNELNVRSATTKSNFKTAIVAALAIASNRLLETWSSKALALVHERGDFAAWQLSSDLRAEAAELASFTFDVFRTFLSS